MTEKIPDKSWQATHNLGHESLFSAARDLLRHFMASKPISSLIKNEGKSRFTSSFEPEEISKLLINIAAYYRVKFDDGSWEHAEWLHDNEYSGVGILIEDVATGVEISLEFKESCNKIIHAQKIHFDVSINAFSGVEYLNPIVYLYGKKYKKTWKTTLDIVQFCKAAGNVIV